MAQYDPETLILLRQVLEDVWGALPDGSKSEALKSEIAQYILEQAAEGVRDPVRLRASALDRRGHQRLSSQALSPQ